MTWLRGLGAMVRGRLREFRREPSAFYWVLLMPVFWMLVLGVAFGPRERRFHVGWVEGGGVDSASGFAAQVHEVLARDSEVVLVRGKYPDLESALKRGSISFVLTAMGEAHLDYRFDPQNRQAVFEQEIIDQKIQRALGRRDVAEVSQTSLTVPGTRYVDFLVPGLLALSIMTTGLFGVGTTLVSNRRENLLKRYLITPMNRSAFFLSHLIGRWCVLLLEVTVVLGAAWLLLDVPCPLAAIPGVLLCGAIGAATFVALGVLLGSRTRTLSTVTGVTNLLSLPSVLAGGVFFGTTHLPQWFEPVAHVLPLTALAEALRRMILEGAGIAGVAWELGILTLYAGVFGVFGRGRFRWF